MTGPKVIYQITAVGDDETGDGSLQRPVATMDRALDLFEEGDRIAREGVLLPDEVPVAEHAPPGGTVVLWTVCAAASVVLFASYPAALPWAALIIITIVVTLWLSRPSKARPLAEDEVDEFYRRAL